MGTFRHEARSTGHYGGGRQEAGGRRSRPPRTAVFLLALVGSTPSVALARGGDLANQVLGHLRGLQSLLGAVPSQRPQVIRADDPSAPLVSLAALSDPVALERRLRDLVKAPYTTIRLNIPNGTARLGDYSLGPSESLTGHLLVVRGKADVYGKLAGNLVGYDGDVLVHPGAVITGDALAIGGRVRNLGGTVTGDTRSVGHPDVSAAAPVSGWGQALANGAGVLGVFFTLTLLGFGLVVFGKQNLEIVSDTVSHSFVRSFLVGLLAQVLLVPTFGVLVVGLVLSVVGILLVPFVVAVYALLAIAGIVGGFLAVAHSMGETHTRRRLAAGAMLSPNSFRYMLVGLGAIASVWLAWVFFGWVPLAGSLVFAAAVLVSWLLATVGLGACVLSRAGVRPSFAGRYVPPEMLTDEYLWATPRSGVPAVQRPTPKPESRDRP